MASDRDTFWAWVVLIGSFLSLLLNGALMYGAGVIHLALLQEFGESDTYTSFVGSVYTSLVLIVAPLGSLLINIFNCRVTMILGGVLLSVGLSLTFFAESLTFVLLTYGITAGIGNALNAVPPVVSIGYYFNRKRSFAIGIATSGAALGTLISGPLFQSLVDTYGIRGTFLLLGGISANQIALGALLRPSQNEKLSHRKQITQDRRTLEHIYSKIKNMLEFSILKEKTFVLILAQFLIWAIPVALLLLHLPNFAVSEGATRTEGAFLLFLVGLTGTFGRILSGLAVGPDGIDPVLMTLGQTGCAGVVTLLFPAFSSSYVVQCIFAAIFGIYNGGVASIITPLLVEILGLSKLSSAIGVMYFFGGIGFIIGPTLAGFLLDKGGTYQLSFYISGMMMVTSSLLTLLSSMWRKDIFKKDDDKETSELHISAYLTESGNFAGSQISLKASDEVLENSVLDPFLESPTVTTDADEKTAT